ncbi:Uncharacterized protein TCM_020808 [Theobroma cacao]|uniref:Uncharacterized protein n=1 Tax=Theobroma cacao TaxID=3641 RepID=A0A061ELK9_THECC|nr:Uncharacterized protein TCM_020808 [Theobroma cacao]
MKENINQAFWCLSPKGKAHLGTKRVPDQLNLTRKGLRNFCSLAPCLSSYAHTSTTLYIIFKRTNKSNVNNS